MSKNIEINYLSADGYEVLYPKTLADNISGYMCFTEYKQFNGTGSAIELTFTNHPGYGIVAIFFGVNSTTGTPSMVPCGIFLRDSKNFNFAYKYSNTVSTFGFGKRIASNKIQLNKDYCHNGHIYYIVAIFTKE